MSGLPTDPPATPGVKYYTIREGRPPNNTIAIHRVYDSIVACFQEFINAGIESMDVWAITTNSRGSVVNEWLVYSYTRDSKTLHKASDAGTHNEHLVTPPHIPPAITPELRARAEAILSVP